MLQIRSETQLEREEQTALAVQRQRANPVLTSLANYVSKAFQDAELHRRQNGVTDRMLKSKRLKQGVYEAEKLSAIRQRGGSELFFNITETKCEAFEAWLNDVFAPAENRPWDVVPTPIPTLPAALTQRVIDATVTEFSAVEAPSPADVQQYASDLYDETMAKMFEQAKERAEAMARKMLDQTIEGGFTDAVAQFISDLATYPSAILKGPVLTRTKRLAWQAGQVAVQEEVIPTWYCVDPLDFYPGPNARSVGESYVCERVYWDRRQLAAMRQVDGWDANAINAIIAESTPSSGVAEPAEGSERAALEDRDVTSNSGQAGSTVDCIEYWGSVQGAMLAEWGMKGVDDPNDYYEVNCVLRGEIVIRAVLNPDPLGRRPYYASSFIKNRGSIWGVKSIPEKMEDCQEGVNGAQRNLLNNLAIASGPQVAADIDALPPAAISSVDKLWPWKIWPYRGSKTQGREPIRFFQPSSNSAELLEVAEFFEKKADDRTLIPRYVYGDEGVSGAGSTASGLSMLMNAAARGIKRVIKNIDRDVLRPAIDRLYTWNMRYLEDENLKGDVQIVARGALAMLTREQTQLRRQEFLTMTNNPTDLQIVGIEGRAALLREIAKGLDIPVDDIVPNKDELQRRVQAQLAVQQPEQMPGGAQ